MKPSVRPSNNAAVGWAELLRFMAHEPDPAQRRQAAQLLGLPALPVDVFETLANQQTQKRDSRKDTQGLTPASPTTGTHQIQPLQVPNLWTAHVVHEPAPAVLKAFLPQALSAQDAAKVEGWQHDGVGGVPQAPVLWPSQHPLHRQLRRSVQGLAQGWHSDWDALLHRISLAHWPWPVPQRLAQQGAHQLHIVMDWAEGLRVFKFDVLALQAECAQRWPRLNVELHALEGGPQGHLQSSGLSLRQFVAQMDAPRRSILVLVSDLSRDGHGQPSDAWQKQLQLLRRRLGAVLVFNPCEAIHSKDAEEDSAQTLLAALSPALTLEPQLVRAMRLALFPNSSAALERAVWQHPDGVGNLPARQWRTGVQKTHQQRLAQLPAAQVVQVAQVLKHYHDHCCTVQRDEECVNLRAVWRAEVAALAQAQGIASPDFDGALAGMNQVALHLQGLVGGKPHEAIPANAELVSFAAQDRLSRLPESVLQDHQEIKHCLVIAASHKRTATLPTGLSDLPDELLPEDESVEISLYQQGGRLVLWHDMTNGWIYLSGESDAIDAFEESPKLRLATAIVRSRRLVVTVAGQARTFMLDQLTRPVVLTYADTHGGTVTLAWHAGRIQVQRLQRPLGVHSWWQDRDGIHAQILTLTGKTLVMHANPEDGRYGEPISDALTKNVLTKHMQSWWRKQGVQLHHGIDSIGVFADLELFTPDAGFDVPMVITQRLRHIPPGTFLMGTPDGMGHSDEHPQHPVTISEGFWLADTPCTQALWQAVMGSNPSHFGEGPDAARRPVESVTFDDPQKPETSVKVFLQRLQALLPVGVQASLPTEAQWEYACRAGSRTAYWWGDEWDDRRSNVGGKNTGTTPVEKYPPNPWGLHDMHGNVREWCMDAGLRDYAAQAEAYPLGQAEPGLRVLRGGSWFLPPDGARSASRLDWPVGWRLHDRGFRLLLRSSSTSQAGQAASRPEGGA